LNVLPVVASPQIIIPVRTVLKILLFFIINSLNHPLVVDLNAKIERHWFAISQQII